MTNESQSDLEFNLNIIKNLSDKNEEKREAACKELEVIVRRNADRKNHHQIEKIIAFFRDKYVKSNDMNRRRAGIEALTQTVSGYRQYPECVERFTEGVLRILLASLGDSENKIRYAVVKSLFYVVKTLDEQVVRYFNLIFEEIIGKVNDLDEEVKQAAKFLDNSLQTILHSSLSSAPEAVLQQFSLKEFMWIVKIKIKSMSPAVREYLIRWVTNLNEVIAINLLAFLPEVLEDLLFMLGDKEKNLRKSAEDCLANFEKEIAEKFHEGSLDHAISYETVARILEILIRVAKGKSSSYTKLSALVWLKLFFGFFKAQIESEASPDPKVSESGGKLLFKRIILERFDEVLEAILLLMSHEEEEVRKSALASNELLMQNIHKINKEETINFGKVMPLLKEMLSEKKSTSTSESALRWMKFLLENYNDKILPEIEDIIEKLAEKLCESNTRNVIEIIENTTVREEYFELFIERMLALLMQRAPSDPEFRAELILKKFCSILEADKFCRSVCFRITQKAEDRKFVFEIVQNLNNLIVTEKSMARMRRKLQNRAEEGHNQFFTILFQAFRYSPAAATSLCLLSQEYELAYRILISFGMENEMTPAVLTGFCKLASMIESPGFLFLRLQILEKASHPFLIESLSALLMFLPQGKIFNMLKNRLEVSKLLTQNQTQKQKEKEPSSEKRIGIQQCLDSYLAVQKP